MHTRHEFIEAVRRNCDISDARCAGLYSICGLALRLRDLYKWEHALAPWVEKDSAEIIDWIDARERRWEQLDRVRFERLPLNGRMYDAFDTSGINPVLDRDNLFYGALIAQRLKPMFFIAVIDRRLSAEGVPVLVLGQEIARDLATVPALNLDDVIVVRTAAAALHLWDQALYIRKSGRPALEFALQRLGSAGCLTDSVRLRLPRLLEARLDTYIYHELAEMRETQLDRERWRRIIADYPQTAVELLARACKDLLADTHPDGPLHRMIEKRDALGLALYTAFCDGMLADLFSGIRPAFAAFADSGRWEVILQAVETGQADARRWAKLLTRYHEEGRRRDDPGWARLQIETHLKRHLDAKKPQL